LYRTWASDAEKLFGERMTIQQAIALVCEGTDLSGVQMQAVMESIMTGACSEAAIAGFLVALRMKGETVEEITAAATVMRNLAAKIDIQANNMVDMVGTGGDASGTFNISTCSALVIAAAGGAVAKHGNRSVSSKSGSADVLEAAGVKLDADIKHVAQSVEQIGIGFMFAPVFHGAMKHAIGPRRALGVRTVFNLLGPLTNPAGVTRQVTGVFSRQWVQPVAAVLRNLGSEQVMIVHGEDGMDEISISAPTSIAELKQGAITTATITPEQFGLQRAPIEAIQVNDATESLAMIHAVLDNTPGAARDIVCLNAGAAIYVAGLATSMAEGVAQADAVIASGKARAKLSELVAFGGA
jgi:anthranilate phosphoribosyltransferase